MTAWAIRVEMEAPVLTGSALSSASVQTAGKETSAASVSVPLNHPSHHLNFLLHSLPYPSHLCSQMWTSAVGAPAKMADTVWIWSMTFTVNVPMAGKERPVIHVSQVFVYVKAHSIFFLSSYWTAYVNWPVIFCVCFRWKSVWLLHMQ